LQSLQLSLSASSAVTVDRQTLLTSRRENRKQRRLNKKNNVIDTEDIEFFTQQRSLQSFNPTPRPPTPRPPTPRPPTPGTPFPTDFVSIYFNFMICIGVVDSVWGVGITNIQYHNEQIMSMYRYCL